MVLSTTLETENALACQRDGTQPPIVDPTITPIQIAFRLMSRSARSAHSTMPISSQ